MMRFAFWFITFLLLLFFWKLTAISCFRSCFWLSTSRLHLRFDFLACLYWFLYFTNVLVFLRVMHIFSILGVLFALIILLFLLVIRCHGFLLQLSNIVWSFLFLLRMETFHEVVHHVSVGELGLLLVSLLLDDGSIFLFLITNDATLPRFDNLFGRKWLLLYSFNLLLDIDRICRIPAIYLHIFHCYYKILLNTFGCLLPRMLILSMRRLFLALITRVRLSGSSFSPSLLGIYRNMRLITGRINIANNIRILSWAISLSLLFKTTS